MTDQGPGQAVPSQGAAPAPGPPSSRANTTPLKNLFDPAATDAAKPPDCPAPPDPASAGAGKPGCRCVDVSSAPFRTVSPRCPRACGGGGDGPDAADGLPLAADGTCAPPDYGAGGCLPHDRWVEPPGGAWTNTPWCYVDRHACGKESEEEVFRSSLADYFPEQDFDLFWSASTCDPANDGEGGGAPAAGPEVFNGTTLHAAVPGE